MITTLKQKGSIAILLSILILGMLLVIGMALSILMFQQLRMSSQAGKSVVAFYAADTGAERCLYAIRHEDAVTCPYSDVSLDFDANAMYTTTYDGVNTVTSIGHFGDVSRKVELTW